MKERERERKQRDESELKGRDLRSLPSRRFFGIIQETGPPGPDKWLGGRLGRRARRSARRFGRGDVHAQIGHNEPNQAASVHTIDNKPYIFDSRRPSVRATRKREGGRRMDLYPE